MSEIDIPINKLQFDEQERLYTANISELWNVPMYHYPLRLAIIPNDGRGPIPLGRPNQERKNGELLFTDYFGTYTQDRLRIFHDASFDELANAGRKELTTNL